MTAMTCEKFEAILPEYLEGDLNAEATALAEAHAKECARCGAIVADIDRITREASALPELRPARDLWPGIEARISAPVIPFAVPAHRNARRIAPWMAAAAAALIVATAGVTYVATSRLSTPQPARVAVTPPAPVSTVDPAATESPEGTVGATNGSVPSIVAGNGNVSTSSIGSRSAENRVSREAGPTRSGGAALASNDPSTRVNKATTAARGTLGATGTDATYDREIALLEKMISAPKSGLDPATVQVVRKNLEVIDDAIAQSKAALAKDPASPLLYDQVTRALSKKVELLRTMASLSSST